MNNDRNNRRKPAQPSVMAMEHGKVPPNALDLEEAVLGAVMLESEALSEVTDILTAESFYKLEHQRIYAAIEHLYANDEPVDILTVTAHLKKEGNLELVGGAYYISELTDRVASSANSEFHARIIQQKFLQREVIRVTGDIYHKAFDDTTDVLELLDEFSNQSQRLAALISRSNAGSMEDYLGQVIEDVSRVQSGEIIGLSTGFDNLDRVMHGRQPQELIVIAGRPAMGKSAVALCEAMHMAEQGRNVAFFSLEMGGKQLAKRLMGIDTGIHLNRFKSGDVDDAQKRKMKAAKQKWAKLGLFFIDDVMSFNGIRAEARRLHEKHGLQAMYVDYLQLCQHTVQGGNRENVISEMSRGFKLMAKNMNLPVILLSQLSRSVETRGGTKRPMLSDLRESGAIEQDADIVEFIFRPEYYGIELSEETNQPTAGLAERIVAKNRDGDTAVIPMRFEAPLTRFTDWTEISQTGTAECVPSALRPSVNFEEKKKSDFLPF